jgi:hypothetical protein
MSDFNIPESRSVRPDRRLISTLTDNPQLVKYLENLGLNLSEGIPDFLGDILDLILAATETGLSAQSTANKNSNAIDELALRIQGIAGQESLLARLLASTDELSSRFDALPSPSIDTLSARVGDLESLIIELRQNRDLSSRIDDIENSFLDSRASQLALSAEYRPLFLTISSTFTAAAAPAYQPLLIGANASSAAFTIKLPAIPGGAQLVNIKKIDGTANIVTVDGNGLLIDGAATKTIGTALTNLQMQYTGSAWFLL